MAKLTTEQLAKQIASNQLKSAISELQTRLGSGVVAGSRGHIIGNSPTGAGGLSGWGGRQVVGIPSGTAKSTNKTNYGSSGTNYNKFIYNNSGTPYLDQYKTLKKGYEKQLANETAQLSKKEAQEIADSNRIYDANARQNYINYMQNKKNLPSQLNALGIRGGASESSLVRLGTTYGQNVATNEAARATAQDALRQTYAQQIQEMRNDYNRRITEARANADAKQLEWETAQKDKDLQRFSGTIQGLYKTKDGYKKLIEKLKASKDPNRQYKIALAQQAMNQLKDEESSGSGGGGGGGRRGGGRSYGGSGSGSGSGSDSGSSGANNANKAIENSMQATVEGVKKAKKKKAKTSSSSSAISARMRRAGSKAYSKPKKRKIFRWS